MWSTILFWSDFDKKLSQLPTWLMCILSFLPLKAHLKVWTKLRKTLIDSRELWGGQLFWHIILSSSLSFSFSRYFFLEKFNSKVRKYQNCVYCFHMRHKMFHFLLTFRSVYFYTISARNLASSNSECELARHCRWVNNSVCTIFWRLGSDKPLIRMSITVMKN